MGGKLRVIKVILNREAQSQYFSLLWRGIMDSGPKEGQQGGHCHGHEQARKRKMQSMERRGEVWEGERDFEGKFLGLDGF